MPHGATAGSLIPCNSVYRGYDADEVDPLLLGTCGAVVNTVDDMETCYRDIPIGEFSTALNDPSPFTLLALLLAVAKRRQVPWSRISGTSNQSDYISHFVCNHMFFRLALPVRAGCWSTISCSPTSTCPGGTRCRWSGSICSRAGPRRRRPWG